MKITPEEVGVVVECPKCRVHIHINAEDEKQVQRVADRFDSNLSLTCPQCEKTVSLPSWVIHLFGYF